MRKRAIAALAALAVAPSAWPQGELETVEVVGTTPLGTGIDTDRIASNTQSATAEDLRRSGALDLTDFLQRNMGSVFVNEAQNNPLQPDVQYRGFVGSPLLGLPQGIAVYQDAVRINEPFGDTVNWALVPTSAIDTVYLMPGSNPLFGLNALGGALSIVTKDGFSHPGTRAEVSAGSFSRLAVQAETGGSVADSVSYFVTGEYLEEDGWRDFSPTEAKQLFASVGWRGERSSVEAALNYADTDLIGNGAAPVELLRTDREAIFTRPDQTENELALLNLTGRHAFTETLSLDGNLYTRASDIGTYNGDDSDFEACDDLPAFMCEEEGDEEELLFDGSGEPIQAEDALEGATINRTSTEQDSVGFSVQITSSARLAGHENLFVAGVAHDESDIAFAASTELGTLDATRRAVPGGVFVSEAFTRMTAETSNSGIYFANTFSLSETLALSVSGRFNRTDVTLRDQLGTALDGDHDFDRFNPAVGLTYAFADAATFYASYSESNRAPSPVELTCADEDDPCRLPNAFLADPPLEQVVADTFEAGIRGTWTGGGWNAGVFRTTNEEDILFISAGALTNEGFFDNVGRTRRDGLELNASGNAGDRLSWRANYTWLDATFRSDFTVPSPNNPRAIGGEIPVESGDRLPLVPNRIFKGGLEFEITPQLRIGGDLLASSGIHYRGDEGNLTDKVEGYALVNLRGEYRMNGNARVFVSVNNVLDEEYETFGLFGEPDEVLGDEFQDSRFHSPGAPRAAWVGFRLQF